MLAEKMANKAQLMRDVFKNALDDEQNPSKSLQEQHAAFKQILIHDMDTAQFADVYAQTIAYGLFTARLHDPSLADFSRHEARELIPKSNPFLRKLFDYVCGADLEEGVKWIIDALCEVYRAADIKAILQGFGKQTGRDDPIVHFYETFLGEYDAKLRKARGVWYTPEPVVNFIVRAIDEVLQTHFGLPDGLADTSKVKIQVETQEIKNGKRVFKEQEVHRVQLLDVAAGTGTFTAEAIKQIHAKFEGQMGIWSQYVEQDLLPRLHGFEILMASYAMCHLKIDLLLTELGYKPSNPNNPPRLGVYLTNALEEYHPDANTLFGSWLAAEANEASRIKRDMPIMVAYGNPPYSVSSQNKGDFIQKLVADYKKDLNEKNINPLSDDYIKFIRYAEHYVEKTGYGIVAMITNNSFYDGIIHRQMRKHLMETFDHIYIYDLHGSAKKQETAPDGSKDQNVFDIMQGVGISIFVKDGSRKGEMAQVKNYDSYGTRTEKYERLWEGTLLSSTLLQLNVQKPKYFFTLKSEEGKLTYDIGFGLTSLFVIQAAGIQSERDELVLQENVEVLKKIRNDLLQMDPEAFRSSYNERPDGRDWKISTAKKDISINEVKEIQVLYRPFDKRHTLYTGKSKGFLAYPRNNVMRNFVAQDNMGLIFVRQVAESAFNHALVTNLITDRRITISAQGAASVAPIYIYPDEKSQKEVVQGDLLTPHPDPLPQGERGQHPSGRRPNLNMAIVAQIAEKLGLEFWPDHETAPSVAMNGDSSPASQGSTTSSSPVYGGGVTEGDGGGKYFTPLDLLDYIYAVLHSPTYREKYKEFLKIDFPRIPYPENADIFWQLVALGREIRGFHLLEHPALSKFITTFPEGGDCVVEKPVFVVDHSDPPPNSSGQAPQNLGSPARGEQSTPQGGSMGRVRINDNQYFGNVPQIAWDFYIGGYQPAQKWLKDRKGRKLSPDDIKHYQKIIIALVNTDRLMKEIDEVWKP